MTKARSIRQALTVWYVGVLVVILLLLGGVLYASVAFSLESGVDQRLTLQAQGLAETIAAFREAEQAAPGMTPGNWKAAPLLGAELPEETMAELIRRWAKRTGLLETERMVCVMDRYGQLLAASAGFQQSEIPPSQARILQALEGETLYETLRVPGQRFHLITTPVMEYGRVRYLIQVSASLAPADESLRQLRGWLGGLIPLAMMLAGIGGWTLAGQALRPVDRMTRQARTISAEALDRRIEVPETGDELERLARTFNDLLGRVETAFRRQRQFSAAASHELRTPLTVMRGELEVALRRLRSPEEYQQVLKAHLQTIREMSQIVEELLMLARADAAGQAIDWQHVELRELVEEIREAWRGIAGRKGVQIEVHALQPVWILGEKRLLTRLVGNLVDNAVRHTPEGSTVTVRADFWRDKACLMVQDDGPGIPAEELPQIFDRFFEGKARSGDGHSFGLGLGLCRWIAEVHHGRIEAASPPGLGALFTVWLPLLKD